MGDLEEVSSECRPQRSCAAGFLSSNCLGGFKQTFILHQRKFKFAGKVNVEFLDVSRAFADSCPNTGILCFVKGAQEWHQRTTCESFALKVLPESCFGQPKYGVIFLSVRISRSARETQGASNQSSPSNPRIRLRSSIGFEWRARLNEDRTACSPAQF